MLNIKIKKGRGIEGLVAGMLDIEEESSLTADQHINVLCALAGFKKHIASVDFSRRAFQSVYTYVNKASADFVLTPEELTIADRLIYGIAEERERFDAEVFISMLIQNSYEAGHNGFILDTCHDHIGAKLRGIEDRPILLTTGSIGHHGANKSDYLHMHIRGDAESNFGCDARNCLFTIDGYLGHGSGSGGESTFIIKEDVDTRWMYSGFNVLKVHREENITGIRRNADFHKLILVRPDGTEELIEERKRKEREEPDHLFGFAP